MVRPVAETDLLSTRMEAWAGVALTLGESGSDGFVSRLPVFLHPLAGRSLVRHVLHAMTALDPVPKQLLFAASTRLDEATAGALAADMVEVDPSGAWGAQIAARLARGVHRVLLVDAAAPTLSVSLAALIDDARRDRVLRDVEGEPLALWLSRATLEGIGPATSLRDLAATCEDVPASDPGEAFAVRNRELMARAGTLIRDRIVRRLMANGVTFLLPETVLVDVDVVVGPDTVIYPGVVLEGETQIGSETVIGPGCRIIDSRVGNGVELKGWNYLVGTKIRNRAVLEPHVRRGFD